MQRNAASVRAMMRPPNNLSELLICKLAVQKFYSHVYSHLCLYTQRMPSFVPQNKSSVNGWLAMHVATLHRGTDTGARGRVNISDEGKIFKDTLSR